MSEAQDKTCSNKLTTSNECLGKCQKQAIFYSLIPSLLASCNLQSLVENG
uniref:Uncharacterized protein n=1 Tax=Manihot esculenta TaxID=3983 RepID=A0A2C9UBS2_MANES